MGKLARSVDAISCRICLRRCEKTKRKAFKRLLKFRIAFPRACAKRQSEKRLHHDFIAFFISTLLAYFPNFFSRGLDAEFEACRMCVSSPMRRPSLRVEGRGSWTIEIADECGLSPAFEASLAPRGASRTLSSDDRSKIELKSLILAQIERWRHALHMQVERQRGSLLPPASGERVRNASGRADQRGITA